jgi:hypothetical protein
MTAEHRIGLIVGLITVLITLVMIALLDARSEPSPPVKACEGIQDTEKIRRLMERGFDSAFTAQIGQLYKVYTTNAPSVEKQREYTRKGIENAIVAYRIGISAIEAWEC